MDILVPATLLVMDKVVHVKVLVMVMHVLFVTLRAMDTQLVLVIAHVIKNGGKQIQFFLELTFKRGKKMGKEVLPDMIDFEIRSLISKMNSISSIQTIDSCSGFSGINDGPVSDGINRVWKGTGHISFLLVDAPKGFEFLKFLMDRIMIDNLDWNLENNKQDFERRMKEVGLNVTEKNLVDIHLRKVDSFVCVMLLIGLEKQKSDLETLKIWNMMEKIVDEFIAKGE